MRNRILYLALLAVIILKLPSCNKIEVSPVDVIILYPGNGVILYSGTTCRITWNAVSSARVDLGLLMETDLFRSIALDISNKGVFEWDIPDDLPVGSDYSLQVSDPADNSRTIYSHEFEIRHPGERSSFTDERDGQTYETVKIGEQWWMAENFNLSCEGSFCYKDVDSNCLLFGRLYTWKAAIENAPRGWHLPADWEWKQLEKYLGMHEDQLDQFEDRGSVGGKLLAIGGGTGFNSIPGGYYNSCVSKYGHAYWEAHLWTSNYSEDGKPIIRVITINDRDIGRVATICHGGSSVRYIKDTEPN